MRDALGLFFWLVGLAWGLCILSLVCGWASQRQPENRSSEHHGMGLPW